MTKIIRKSKIAKSILIFLLLVVSALTYSFSEITAGIVSATFLFSSFVLIGTMI